MNLARSYVALGRLTDAADQYREIVNAEPSNADACFNLAALMEALGHLEEARRYLLKTLELDPSDQTARERLERLDAQKGNKQPTHE